MSVKTVPIVHLTNIHKALLDSCELLVRYWSYSIQSEQTVLSVASEDQASSLVNYDLLPDR